MSASPAKPPPVRTWKIGKVTLLALPLSHGMEVLQLVCAFLIGSDMVLMLFGGRESLHWIDWTGLGAVLVQAGIALASLLVRRRQKRRAAGNPPSG